MRLKVIIALTGSILNAAAAQSQAQVFEDVAALDARVASVAQAQPIDARLKLARCPQPIVLEPEQIGAIVVRCEPIGWRIRVPVIAAAKAATSTEMLVRRGETVEMASSGDGFEISTSATAMEDGALGAPVRVKSLTGGAVTVAVVTGQGSVKISR